MRWGLIALGAVLLTACAEAAPNAYPESARAQFHAQCPSENAVCSCTWDKLTRTLTYEEYTTALNTFRETGLMEPRVTRARTYCTERHHE
jgi:hypothetical protein